MPFVYILKCADNSYYTGSTIDLEMRLAQHQAGHFKGYTSSRLPVQLLWYAELPTEDDAFLRERQIKGWSRAKKEALIREDWDRVHGIVKEERERRRRLKSTSQKDRFAQSHPSTTVGEKMPTSALDA